LVLHAPAKDVDGEAFNVATGTDISVLRIAQDVVRMMHYDPERIQFVGDRLGQVVRHRGSWKKISDRLGWRPEVAWEEGLAKTIEWYRGRRSIWEKQIPMRRILVRTQSGKVEFH
jgi:dTDP-glucose 4,6-dehydratase